MTAAVIDRECLSKLLGMLGSAHDGEVAAAGRAADALVRRAGTTWFDVLRPALPAPDQDHDLDFVTVAEACRYCLLFADLLTDMGSRILPLTTAAASTYQPQTGRGSGPCRQQGA